MFGVVIFDEDDKPGPGWASKGGKAFRVRGTGDLASDITWWTNLKFDVFQKYGLFRANLKRFDFMRPDMYQLHGELGIDAEKQSPSRICEITAEVFKRVMTLAVQHYELDQLTEDTLMEELYKRLIGNEKILSPELSQSMKKAWQSWQMCEAASPNGSKITSFKRPRILHAMDVLCTPIPSGGWEQISRDEMPVEEKRVNWLLNQERPVLVKASVIQVPPDVARIISFGGGATSNREWMSHPELLYLSRFAKIRVDECYMAESYSPQPVKLPLETGGAMGLLSISMGILAENYWSSLAAPYALHKKTKNKVLVYSPRAVWISAADRFQMMMASLIVHNHGFVVKAYGKGGVNIAVQNGMQSEVVHCAKEAGLLPPLGYES